MDARPIGVFDSGLGGLTAVRQLLCHLPSERIVYFGDTGRVPYGTRGEATITAYAAQDCRFLLQHDVKLIIAACGTVSSVAPQVLESLPVPAIGVIEPAARRAASLTRNGRVGIIGTAATIRSGAFARHIAALRPQTQVLEAACPLLVSLVESGWIQPDNEVTKLTIERYLRPLKEQGIDTLILGCTHFPLLAPLFAAYLGDGVQLVDSGREAALACGEILRARDLLNGSTAQGDCRFYVSDRPQNFAETADMFLGRRVEQELQPVDVGTL